MKKHNRREFLKLSSMAVAGTMLPLTACSTQEALVSDKALSPDVKLKVGLIGCGGRGTGAANQALNADPNVELVAVCDIFPDKIENALFVLRQRHGDKINVPEERQFVGFDSYKDVISSGIDVVIHGAPPGFRPGHVEASVDAGLHMFVEKPVAVDAPGVRRMFEAVRKAREKELSIVSGFCWRYHYPKRAIYERILNGAVGDIRTIYNTYNTGAARFDQRPADWSDEEFQLRNWIYYNWMSGDHIVEQAVHSIDFMQWAMGDQLPVSAMGTGGRQVRVEPEFGDIYDHFAITYEYANGAKGFHFSRQQPNCENSYKAEIYGSDGVAIASVSRNQHSISARNNWSYDGEENNMYQTQHDELFAAIRRGIPINDGEYMTNSTLVAIMGRMAAYTGRRISVEQALNSEEQLGPDNLSWETIPKFSDLKVPMPGITPFV
ncbi:MAG: gfo/Idh/MocA family oxidoreductase [Balneolaceae bacterium]|nr:MAG: gfo/Idh/MocA family oxidoreductase [Balneolaceae bacterium]